MIKIVLVEERTTIRKGLELIISSSPDFTCSGSFSDYKGMLEKIEEINPDILLIDINLSEKSAVEVIKKAKRILPGIVILVLLIYMQSEKVFEALCSGACGYIEKNLPSSHLLNAMKIAHKGGSPMSAQIAIKIQELLLNKKLNGFPLNASEKHVLNELIYGSSYKAIANKLSINIETVQHHIRNIYIKLYSNFN